MCVRAGRIFAGGAVALLGLALAACGSGGGGGSASGTLSVVASTNVYGDIVKQIAGDLAGNKVRITSIVSDPNADPHSYEANSQNQLALSRAALVIENGGGYDDFVDTMLKAARSKATVLNVVELSGHVAAKGESLNEHVWYDFPTVEKLVDQIVADLSAKDAADAATFRANAAAFEQKLQGFVSTEASISSAHAGDGVAITEPVPLYLLDACGLANKTPGAFSEAIEQGTDVSPTTLRDTLNLFSGKQVKVLVYNEQTAGPETEQVLNAAKSNHIPVVPVTETLPAGKDYLTWMADNLAAISSALG